MAQTHANRHTLDLDFAMEQAGVNPLMDWRRGASSKPIVMDGSFSDKTWADSGTL